MDKLTYFRQCFASAEQKGLIKFEVGGKGWSPNWFNVSYKETLGAEGDKSDWRALCSQDLRDYTSTEEHKGEQVEVVDELALVQRVTMMLCETLRSTRQDVNIYREEYVNIKKPRCSCSMHEGWHYKKDNCIK
jgi:hypothetical protein